MNSTGSAGWEKLLQGYPWFSGKGQYPIPAYSEFMPPPRLGKTPYGYVDISQFDIEDPFGWNITEVEEESELRVGIAELSRKILDQLVELGEGKPATHIAGHEGRNLRDNPYWPPELASRAGQLSHERYVIFLPISLSRTQDDKGRIRWTFFGGSEHMV